MERYERHLQIVIVAATGAATAWMFADGSRWTEYVAFLSGAASVWLFMRNNVWSWSIGLVNSSFLFWVFWDAHLFADMWLQAAYLVLGVGGWWMWLRPRNPDPRPTMHATQSEVTAVVVAVAAGWALMYWYFSTMTSAASPLWDSLLTSGSLGAQYLLMRRKVENWWLWIAVDVGYIALFWVRDLHITAALYVVFLFMALNGRMLWRDDVSRELVAA